MRETSIITNKENRNASLNSFANNRDRKGYLELAHLSGVKTVYERVIAAFTNFAKLSQTSLSTLRLARM